MKGCIHRIWVCGMASSIPRINMKRSLIFALGWIAYGATYFLRKPLGVIKVDMESELHLTKSALGWLDMAFLLPYAVMQMILGHVGDKFGARRTFGCALIISSMSMITFGNWSNCYVFGLLLFLNGTAQSQCWPNATKVVASWFSDDVRNSVFGMFGTCVFAGGILATMIAVYLQLHYGWRTTFFWPSIGVLAVGVLVLLFYQSGDQNLSKAFKKKLKTEEKNPTESERSQEVVSMKELCRMPMVVECAVGMFCMKLVRYCMYMWLPMYLLQQLHYSKSMAGMMSTMFEVGGVLGSVLIGFVLDRLFKGRSMLGTALSMLLSSVALVLFSVTGSWGPVFNASFLFLAGCFNAGPDSILGGSIPAEIASLDGRKAIGATIGFVNGFGSLGSCLEGPLVGLVSSHFGWSSVFYLITGLASLGAVAVFRAELVKSRNVHTPKAVPIEV